MRLNGSCHCQAVQFSLESIHPYPFNLCYCTICRKTAGAGGFAINIKGQAESLQIHQGEAEIQVYQAQITNAVGEQEQSPLQRRFCKRCGSQLWAFDPRWPETLHPHASAIDTPLPSPPERTHLMLSSKADWVHLNTEPDDRCFAEYPAETIAQWHQRLGLECEPNLDEV